MPQSQTTDQPTAHELKLSKQRTFLSEMFEKREPNTNTLQITRVINRNRTTALEQTAAKATREEGGVGA